MNITIILILVLLGILGLIFLGGIIFLIIYLINKDKNKEKK